MGQPEDQGPGPDGAQRRGTLPASSAEIGDALRTAVERTLAATADSATETRDRAQTLLDEVVRRGQSAREEVARRGEEATNRLGGAISDLRSGSEGDLDSIGERLRALEARVAALEGESKVRVEGEASASKPLEHGESG